MVAGDTQTDLAVGFEATRRGREAERGRAQGVAGREHDAAVVDARGVGGVWGPAQGEVPFEEVGFEGGGDVVWGGGLGEFGCFAHWRGLAGGGMGKGGMCGNELMRRMVGDLELNFGVAMVSCG